MLDISSEHEMLGNCSTLQQLNKLYGAVNSIVDEYQKLHIKKTTNEQAIQDTHHYIELSEDISEEDGYAAFLLLEKLLKERREIKDKLYILTPIYNQAIKLSDKNIQQKVETNVKNIYNIQQGDRKYATRVLNNYFGDTIE